MTSQEPRLAAEVASWLDQAEAADAAEDAQHGADRRGDETPAWMADKQRRLERIRAAKAQLEAEAKAGRSDTLGSADPDGPGPSSGMQERGARRDRPADTPPDKAQRNFTDPDSRIMPSQGGFIAGYNGQIAVDAAHQIIVAQQLGTNPADFAALIPLVDQARKNLGRTLREVSGDTGFATEANLEAMAERRVRAYLSPGRIRHGETDPTAGRLLKRRLADAGDGQDDPQGRAAKSIPAPQAGRGARVRAHQAGQRLPTVPPPRAQQGQRPVGDGLHRPQPPQAA